MRLLAIMGLLAIMAPLGGCRGSDVCSKLDAKLAECVPGHGTDDVIKECRKLFAYPKASLDEEFLATREMLECASAAECSDLSGCFEGHGCKMILLGKNAPLAFQCELPSPEPGSQ